MEEKINRLKEKLQYIDTRELLGMIGTKFITFSNTIQDIAEQSNIFNKTNLMSPQKQYIYLAGLLMSTADNSNDTTKTIEIGNYAFARNISATRLTISDKVKENKVGSYAFAYNNILSSVTLHNANISDHMFYFDYTLSLIAIVMKTKLLNMMFVIKY